MYEKKEEMSGSSIPFSPVAYEEQKNQIMKLWEKNFSKKYEETTSKELHIFTHNLVDRFLILKKYPPVSLNSFLKLLFEHPNLSKIDREVKNYFFFHLECF